MRPLKVHVVVTGMSLAGHPEISLHAGNILVSSLGYYQCSLSPICKFLEAQEILFILRSLPLFILLT